MKKHFSPSIRAMFAVTLALAMLLSLTGCGGSETTTKKLSSSAALPDEISLTELNVSPDSVSGVYTQAYQDKVKAAVNDLKKAESYTLSAPLAISNPYGTSTTGLYLYFTTAAAVEITYTVSTDGYADFTRTLQNNGEDNLTTTHEYLLIGMVAGEENTVTLTAKDADGSVCATTSFSFKAPALLNASGGSITLTGGTSTQSLSDGLYVILGNDTTEDDTDADYVTMYDNSGVVRCEIPISSYRAHRLLFDENGMYLSISGKRIARIDSTGYVNRIYSTGNYELHHDYIFGSNGDLLVLGTDTSDDASTKEDLLLSVDTDTGAVTQLIDFKDLLPSYYETAEKPESADTLDWFHANSLSLTGDGSLIVSSRETSTIFKITDLYGTPSIGYMIGSSNFWKESGYDDLLLTQAGDFSLQAGQHCVTVQTDDSLEDGQYYLIMFNNNNTVSATRPDYDWKSDSQYGDTGTALKSNGAKSYYYKYLVDENAGTFTLVDSIAVAYSGYVSSVQNCGGNIIIDSGSNFTTYEFDSDGKLIQKAANTGDLWNYRTMKYDFYQYCFKAE